MCMSIQYVEILNKKLTMLINKIFFHESTKVQKYNLRSLKGIEKVKNLFIS